MPGKERMVMSGKEKEREGRGGERRVEYIDMVTWPLRAVRRLLRSF